MRCKAVIVVLASLLFVACSDNRRPDVVLITIDALRADHLGVYGYKKNISPGIDSLAAGATVFNNAIAQAPSTLPSLLQIMTSRYRLEMQIPPFDTTLAEVLKANGYQTVAIIDNPLLEMHPTARGMMRGFDRFYRNGILDPSLPQQHWKTKTPADVVTAQAVRWLKKRDKKRPFFLWLHYFDPHDPYLPPYADDLEALSRNTKSPFTGDVRNTFLLHKYGEKPPPIPESDRAHLIDLYDAEIQYVDQSITELLDFLKRERLFHPNLIILSSDHGESFGDHGTWLHANSLYESELRIPMIVKLPGQSKKETVQHPVQAIDIFPGILKVARIPTGKLQLDGIAFTDPSYRAAFAYWADWQAVRTADWKLIQIKDERQLFNLKNDPGELQNLSEKEAWRVTTMVQMRAKNLASLPSTSKKTLQELSESAREELESIGYLHK